MSILSTEVSENIVIYDPMSVDFTKFTWINGYYLHKITASEIIRPYMISYAYYGTIIYEDEILLLNKVDDPFSLVIGKELRIPKIEDLKDFILKNRK